MSKVERLYIRGNNVAFTAKSTDFQVQPIQKLDEIMVNAFSKLFFSQWQSQTSFLRMVAKMDLGFIEGYIMADKLPNQLLKTFSDAQSGWVITLSSAGHKLDKFNPVSFRLKGYGIWAATLEGVCFQEGETAKPVETCESMIPEQTVVETEVEHKLFSLNGSALELFEELSAKSTRSGLSLNSTSTKAVLDTIDKIHQDGLQVRAQVTSLEGNIEELKTENKSLKETLELMNRKMEEISKMIQPRIDKETQVRCFQLETSCSSNKCEFVQYLPCSETGQDVPDYPTQKKVHFENLTEDELQPKNRMVSSLKGPTSPTASKQKMKPSRKEQTEQAECSEKDEEMEKQQEFERQRKVERLKHMLCKDFHLPVDCLQEYLSILRLKMEGKDATVRILSSDFLKSLETGKAMVDFSLLSMRFLLVPFMFRVSSSSGVLESVSLCLVVVNPGAIEEKPTISKGESFRIFYMDNFRVNKGKKHEVLLSYLLAIKKLSLTKKPGEGVFAFQKDLIKNTALEVVPFYPHNNYKDSALLMIANMESFLENPLRYTKELKGNYGFGRTDSIVEFESLMKENRKRIKEFLYQKISNL